MSEERIAEFRERAEFAVGRPDFDSLERRGAAMRRRRIAGTSVAAVVAAVALGFGVLPLPGNEQNEQDHADRSSDHGSEEAVAMEADVSLDPGKAAFDEFPLSTGATVRIEVTPPTEGWTVHLGGPQRGVNVGGEKDWTGVLWYEVIGVYKQRCGDKPPGAASVPLTDSLQPLVDKPWTTVVAEPRAAMLGGREAQHARLTVKSCDGDFAHPLVSGGDSGPLPVASGFDIWLVPLPEADTSIVVFDPTDAGSRKYRQEWRQVIDSLKITVEQG